MKSWLLGFAILFAIFALLTGCTVQQKRGMQLHDKLVFYDDTTANVRCYMIQPWDGVSCIKK